MNKIDRTNVNSNRVKAQDFPKSGMDLSYVSRADLVFGHIIPGGYQDIMPSDKFQGSNDTKYTLNDLAVPIIPQVDVSQHNFYIPLRCIDRTFERAMCPDELNDMSASWRTPKLGLKNLVSWCFKESALDNILAAIFPETFISGTTHHAHTITSEALRQSIILGPLKTYFLGLASGAADTYQTDVVMQWYEYANALLSTFPIRSSSGGAYYTYEEASVDLLLFLHAILDFPFGRKSMLDMLGYMYYRSVDLDYIARQLAASYTQGPATGTISFERISDLTDPLQLCEYKIRAYYATWYEHYRDPYLEKRSKDLPDWHDFDGTSLFDSADAIWETICFLLPRIRSWKHDIFVGAMPDDMSRHVYAPIFKGASVPVLSNDYQYEDSELAPPYDSGLVNAVSFDIPYLDPISGAQKLITCPVPKAVNDVLSDLDASISQLEDGFALDLRDLRKSQMLERYLKRNFYFGDEYQERMMAHYGAKVSDNSIRRPHLLKSSISAMDVKQEIANMTNEQTYAGTRVAICQDSAHGDSYEFFSEEFGIVLNLISFIPQAQYAGLCPQNLLSQQTDFPIPEFAPNNDEFGRNLEIAFTAVAHSDKRQYYQFGHFPYAHAWRSRVDEVHGSFLDDRIDYTFARFFDGESGEAYPVLNASYIHCQPRLGCFRDTIRLDGQGYMISDHHFYVERVLPTPVEEI